MSIRNNRWSVRNQERTLKIGVAGAYFIKRDVINRHGLIPAVQYQRKFIIPQIDCPQEDVDNAFRSFVKRNFLGVGKRARNALVDGLKPVPGGRWYKTLAALEMGI